MHEHRRRRPLGQAAGLLAAALCACATFNPFKADLGTMAVEGEIERPAYLSARYYYGYVEPKPPAVPVVYLWLPHPLPELGLRVVSPTRGAPEPHADAHQVQVEDAWRAHAQDAAGFDACVQIARCNADGHDVAAAKASLMAADACPAWEVFGANEDSPEAPVAPGGAARNALVRVPKNEPNNQHVLPGGRYRVQVGACHAAAQAGAFLLQLGSPLSLDGARLSASEQALGEALQREEAALVPAARRPAPFVAPVPDNLAP